MREDLDLEMLDDPRIVTLEEMMRSDSFFPPITQNSFGKAQNAVVKNILSNFGNEKPTRKREPSG